MKIVSIFADDIIWSVKYSDDKDNRFHTLLTQWRDISYLDQFFDKYWFLVEKSRIWKGYSKDELILRTREETQNFLILFKKNYERYLKYGNLDINQIFKVLEGTHQPLGLKAYGNYNNLRKFGKHALLRLYAIETEDHDLLITGGGIKLTDAMQDCDYLKRELERMRSIRRWLEDNDVKCLEEMEIMI